MRSNLVEGVPVVKGDNTSFMVGIVAITAQNFERDELGCSDISLIAILPYLIAVWIVLRPTSRTLVVDFRAGDIPDVLPAPIILEKVVDTLVKERTGNKLRNQNVARQGSYFGHAQCFIAS